MRSVCRTTFVEWSGGADRDRTDDLLTAIQPLSQNRSESRAAYDRHIVPTPGRPFFQAAFGIQTGVNWKNPNRPPLLLIVADEDKTVAPPMVRDTYKKQQRSRSTTAFKAFPNRCHFLLLERGWEKVADYAINWASANARTSMTGVESAPAARLRAS